MKEMLMENALVQVYGTWYIDPIRFLQFLTERASLITERIAVPGTSYSATEALRARRVELQTLIQQLTEHTK
jgi:hypothetical protein